MGVQLGIIGWIICSDRVASARPFVATDLNRGGQVALKLINPDIAGNRQFQQAFNQEMQRVRALDHANIVRVLNYSALPKQAFVVTEYIQGGSLRAYSQFLRQQRRTMESSESMRLTQQLADALNYAHRSGMIHRDLKPENVLLRGSGGGGAASFQALVADFGFARLMEFAPGSLSSLNPNSYAYLAPEQLRGERVDARTDVYALGVILYELTTGQVPFQPRSLNEALQLLTRETVTPPSQINPGMPRELERIILKSLATNPNERQQSASEITQSLQNLRYGGGASQVINTMAEPPAQNPVHYPTNVMPEAAIGEMPQYDSFPAEQRDVGKARVVFSGPGQEAKVLWLTKDVTLIGRDPSQDITLESTQISRSHARIDRLNDGRYRIMDLGSTNGVFLGSSRIPANVPHQWQPGQIARIGDFWFRLEVITPARVQQSNANPAMMRSAVAAAPVLAASREAESTTRRIGVRLIQDNVAIAAGGRNIATAEITNRGDRADQFILEVRGVPREWVTLPSEPLPLAPGEQSTQMFTVHPPKSTQTTAGEHNFDVLARSVQAPNEYATAPGKFQIEAFYGLSTDILPRRIRHNGAAEIQIKNTGNAADTFTIEASDPEQNLELLPSPSEVSVAPGETEKVRLSARATSRPISGFNKTLSFDVQVKSTRPDGEKQSHTVQYILSPLFPAWLVSLLGLSGLGLFTLLLLLGFSLRNNPNLFNFGGGGGSNNLPAGTITIQADGTTQIPFNDNDNDGLTNEQEGTLGTDPNNRDTDGDGIEDGLEVNTYQTDPLKQDTDDDSLTDSQELFNLRTSPTNPDTDGDGIPDAVDEAPLQIATATLDLAATQAAGEQGNADSTQTAEAGVALTTEAQVTPTPTLTPTPILPSLTINDPVPIAEGNVNGLTVQTFSISLSVPNPGPDTVTVNYAVVADTAQDNDDYTSSGASPSSPIAFSPGEQSKLLTIPIISDSVAETNSETFRVVLSQPVGATIAKGTGIGLINDDDGDSSLPSVTIDDASANEDTGSIVFNVRLSAAGSSDVVVQYQTNDGTATTADNDYTGVTSPGSVTFSSGSTTAQQITITLNADANFESDETFSVVLLSASGGTIARNVGTGTIINDDSLPTLNIADDTKDENAGPLTFSVSLNPNVAPASPITVQYSTNNDSAVAPGDYTSTSGSLIFDAGNPPPQVISVPINDDNVVEGTETMQVRLSNPPAGLLAIISEWVRLPMMTRLP